MNVERLVKTILLAPLAPIIGLPFSQEIKHRVNDKANGKCEMCGEEVGYMPPHHIVPENALKGIGIKGKNVEENAVCLCSGENGRGENSPDDCHECVDQMAIKKRLFWKDGEFVPLEKISESAYSITEKGKIRESKRKKHHKNKHK
jgi:hypothetical protein